MNTDKLLLLVHKYRLDLAETGIQPKPIDANKSFQTSTKADFIAHARYLINQFPCMDVGNNMSKAREMLATIQNCLLHIGLYSFGELQSHNRS